MKNILLFILFIHTLNCAAQNAIGRCSARIEANEMPYAQIIGETQNEHIMVLIHSKSKKQGKLIEFNKELLYISEIELNFENESILQCTYLNDKIVLFTSKVIDNANCVLARIYDDYAFSNPEIICKAIFSNSVFDFSKSNNGAYFGIIAETPYIKGTNEEIEVWVFDDVIHEQCYYKLALPEKNTRVKVNVPVMSNTGLFFLIKRHIIAQDNNYFVYTINPEKKKHHRTSLKLMGKRIADIKYQLDDQNNLHLAGFYSSVNYRVFEGCFYYKIDQTSRPIIFKQYGFDFDFLTQSQGKKIAKKNGGLLGYKMGEMNLFRDEIVLSASHSQREKYFVGQEQQISFSTDQLALIILNKDGMKEMTQTLKVKQQSENDRGFWNKHQFLIDSNHLSLLHNQTLNKSITSKINHFSDSNNVFTPAINFELNDAINDSCGLDLASLKQIDSNYYVLAWNTNRNEFVICSLLFADNETHK